MGQSIGFVPVFWGQEISKKNHGKICLWRWGHQRYRGPDLKQTPSIRRNRELGDRQLSRRTFLQIVLTSKIHRKTGNLVGRSFAVRPLYRSHGLGQENKAPFLNRRGFPARTGLWVSITGNRDPRVGKNRSGPGLFWETCSQNQPARARSFQLFAGPDPVRYT